MVYIGLGSLIDFRVSNGMSTTFTVATLLLILTLNANLHIVLGRIAVRIDHATDVAALVLRPDIVQHQPVVVVFGVPGHLRVFSMPFILSGS